MKLYYYDHCPFCTRARMMLGLQNIQAEEIALFYDDEKTPVDLVGQKMLPILVKEDGEAMPESLDIVAYFDENYTKDSNNKLETAIRPEIQTWLENVKSIVTKLTSPRETRIGLAEFARQSAIEYFINKKTPSYGDFDENFAKTSDYLAQMNQKLQEFAPLVTSPEHLGERLGYEDIVVFPILRNLTMVKGVVFPPEVRAYLDAMAAKSQMDLYDQRAI